MDLINKTVNHKIFGEGTICKQSENVISVQFNAGLKRFIFPDAFRKFLILTEEKSKRYVDSILEDQDKKERLVREKEALEAERRRRLESLPVNPKSQAAFGFIDNDNIDNWTVFAGNYRAGDKRGKARVPSRIYPNTACLLTYRGENDPEEDRYIWGVFMVKEDFIGSECSDGIIPAHSKYRIILNESETERLRFWAYFKNEPQGKNAKWGSAEIKYFSNSVMACILNDILALHRNTERQQLCEEFIDYFCKLNRIDRNKIPAGLYNAKVTSNVT